MSWSAYGLVEQKRRGVFRLRIVNDLCGDAAGYADAPILKKSAICGIEGLVRNGFIGLAY